MYQSGLNTDSSCIRLPDKLSYICENCHDSDITTPIQLAQPLSGSTNVPPSPAPEAGVGSGLADSSVMRRDAGRETFEREPDRVTGQVTGQVTGLGGQRSEEGR